MIRMRDSNDFFSISSNRLNVNKQIIIENVRFQHFCQKMWALKKWCVTKVAHCIVNQCDSRTIQATQLKVHLRNHVQFSVSEPD